MRFLLPLVPLLCIPALWVWIEARRLPLLPGLTFFAVMFAAAGSGAVVAAARAPSKFPVAVGREGRQNYLQRHEPTYEAAIWANALTAPNARILSQDHRAYYFNATVTRENIYRRQTDYARQISSPDELACYLQAAGFTHLLLAESLNDRGIRYNNTLSRLADASLASAAKNSLDVLIDYQFKDPDGAVRRYRLVALR